MRTGIGNSLQKETNGLNRNLLKKEKETAKKEEIKYFSEATSSKFHHGLKELYQVSFPQQNKEERCMESFEMCNFKTSTFTGEYPSVSPFPPTSFDKKTGVTSHDVGPKGMKRK